MKGWGAGSIFNLAADNMCIALDEQLNALLGSDSIQKIYADLTVWFGEDAMLQFVPVPEDYTVLPVFSESILHKLHNLETLFSNSFSIVTQINNNLSSADKTFLQNGQHHIYQYNDAIVTALDVVNTGTRTWVTQGDWMHYSGANGAVTAIDCHILDTYRVEPDPEVIVEGSLFKYQTHDGIVGSDVYTEIVSCAFFIPVYVIMWTLVNGTSTPDSYTTLDTNQSVAQQTAGVLALIDWAPLAYQVVGNTITKAYGDMDNVIPLYANDLSRLQRTCVLSGLHTDVRVIVK
jgi:hypothetical protein